MISTTKTINHLTALINTTVFITLQTFWSEKTTNKNETI